MVNLLNVLLSGGQCLDPLGSESGHSGVCSMRVWSKSNGWTPVEDLALVGGVESLHQMLFGSVGPALIAVGRNVGR